MNLNFFETFLRDLILAGTAIGPVFIHSQHGIAILNASEEGLAAILQAHAQAQAAKIPPAVPAASPTPTAQ